MSLELELAQFGLDHKKAKVYLACLESGEAKAQDIALRAGIARPTAYDILEKLSQLGLVGFYRKRGVKYYVANAPEKFHHLLEKKAEHFKQLLPELKSRYNTTHEKPKITYYEGTEGIKTILADTLTARNKQLRAILSIVDLFTLLGRAFMENQFSERVKAGVRLRVIRSRPKEVGENWQTDPRALRELRYAPPAMVFAMTMYLYDNKAALISSQKEHFGMIIASGEYSENMGHLFEALWQISTSV